MFLVHTTISRPYQHIKIPCGRDFTPDVLSTRSTPVRARCNQYNPIMMKKIVCPRALWDCEKHQPNPWCLITVPSRPPQPPTDTYLRSHNWISPKLSICAALCANLRKGDKSEMPVRLIVPERWCLAYLIYPTPCYYDPCLCGCDGPHRWPPNGLQPCAHQTHLQQPFPATFPASKGHCAQCIQCHVTPAQCQQLQSGRPNAQLGGGPGTPFRETEHNPLYLTVLGCSHFA